MYQKLLYVEGLSEKIRKVLKTDQINISMKCENTLKKNLFTSTKDKAPHDLESQPFTKSLVRIAIIFIHEKQADTYKLD